MYFYNDTLRIFDLEGNAKEVVIEDETNEQVQEQMKVLTSTRVVLQSDFQKH